MSSDRIKRLPLLGCFVLLAACPGGADPKDDPEPDAGEEWGDAGEEPGDESDASDEPDEPAKPAADGGTKPGTGKPPSPSQAPAKPSADAGAPEQPAKPTPSNPTTPSSMGPSVGTAQRFFMPTPEPENTRSPRIEFDRNGGLHAVYPAYTGGGAFYAYCPNQCVDPKAMKVVALPTDSAPGAAMLALTPDGRPRVLLSTYLRVFYAECDQQCTDASNWTTSVIVDHQSAQDVTGDAFAVDSQGRPRFLMHTYVAYLGVGQKAPFTYYAQCDANCSNPASWSIDPIQDQIWQYSTLRFDAADRAHISTVLIDPASSVKQLAYVRCDSDCASSTSWNGIQLAPAFENMVADIHPSVSLALTRSGGARIVGLVMPESGARALVYFECDQACEEDNWSYGVMSDAWELGSGVDIALDAQDRPRFVFTLDSNIGVYHCDSTHCTTEAATWDLTKVEFASDLTPDNIILWPNCVADVWFLGEPTIALAADGSVRAGYQATDVSGGTTSMPDPTMTPCLVGKDMVLGRMAILPSL